MRHRLASPARLVLVGLLAAGGCSIFTRSIEKPTAQVRGVAVSSVSLSAVEGELHLDVQNPNSFGVPLAGIEWQLAIGGDRAVSGAVELSQTIPAKGSAPVTASLRIDPHDVVAVAAALARGVRDYQIAAHLRFSTPVGEVAIDVRQTGRLDGELGGLLGGF